MDRISDITSTEKLLKAIRTRKDAASVPAGGPVDPLPIHPGRFIPPLRKMLSIQKSLTVGIDISPDHLRLVRATETSKGHWKVIDRRRFTLPQNMPRNTPEFAAFLKSALTAACGSPLKSKLWATMSTARIDVSHVRIPKVPQKQIANAVYWMVRKEAPFDEKEMVFDFEIQGEVVDQGITKLSALVYTAPRLEIDELKGIFARIGWPLTGISITPFSVQNLFRTAWISNSEGTIANLFIGTDFTRIDIYSANNLVMTRGIKAGLTSMVETLLDRYNEQIRGSDAPHLTIEQAGKIIRRLSADWSSSGESVDGFNLTPEEMFKMIEPALERLSRQVERTFGHYMTTVPGDRIVRIYVSSVMTFHQLVIDYVGSQLGIAGAVMDPLRAHDVVACPDVEDSRSLPERVAFGPALGLAFSDNKHTPNLIYIYKDKERAASAIRINRMVFAASIVSVLLCSGIFLFQSLAIAQKKATVAGLETQYAGLGPAVNQEQISQMALRVSKKRQLTQEYANRYLDLVIIGELTALTPSAVRFTDLKINLGPVATGGATPKKGQAEVTVEGVILGERSMFETALAGYTMALESSLIFQKVTIQKNVVEPYLKAEALHFILNMKVREQLHG